MKRRPLRKTRRELWLWLAATCAHRALKLCEMPADAELVITLAKANAIWVEAGV